MVFFAQPRKELSQLLDHTVIRLSVTLEFAVLEVHKCLDHETGA